MANQDIVDQTLLIRYIQDLTIGIGGVQGASFDTVGFGAILGVSFSLVTESYSNPMTVNFEMSSSQSFSSDVSVIPASQVNNDQNGGSNIVSEGTGLNRPIPTWGFTGVKRYIRAIIVGGQNNEVHAEMTIRLTQKPTLGVLA